jgi:hypothetical protein
VIFDVDDGIFGAEIGVVTFFETAAISQHRKFIFNIFDKNNLYGIKIKYSIPRIIKPYSAIT